VLRSGWPFLVFVGGPVVAWVIGFLGASNAADQVRYAGTLLQLFGLGLVWFGIRGARQTFGSESEFAATRNWLKALARSFREPNATAIVGSGGVAVGVAGLSGFGRVSATTVEDRIQLLEGEVDALRSSMHAEDSRLRAAIDGLKQDLDARARRLASADDELRKSLKSLAVGDGVGRHLSSIGFWWVVMATFATCIPDELATYL
jgi:hypothetical protein